MVKEVISGAENVVETFGPAELPGRVGASQEKPAAAVPPRRRAPLGRRFGEPRNLRRKSPPTAAAGEFCATLPLTAVGGDIGAPLSVPAVVAGNIPVNRRLQLRGPILARHVPHRSLQLPSLLAVAAAHFRLNRQQQLQGAIQIGSCSCERRYCVGTVQYRRSQLQPPI